MTSGQAAGAGGSLGRYALRWAVGLAAAGLLLAAGFAAGRDVGRIQALEAQPTPPIVTASRSQAWNAVQCPPPAGSRRGAAGRRQEQAAAGPRDPNRRTAHREPGTRVPQPRTAAPRTSNPGGAP